MRAHDDEFRGIETRLDEPRPIGETRLPGDDVLDNQDKARAGAQFCAGSDEIEREAGCRGEIARACRHHLVEAAKRVARGEQGREPALRGGWRARGLGRSGFVRSKRPGIHIETRETVAQVREGQRDGGRGGGWRGKRGSKHIWPLFMICSIDS